MSQQFLEILGQLISRVENSTDVLIAELTHYFLIMAVLKIVLLAAVTGFVLRLLRMGIAVINLSPLNTPTDLAYKGLLRTVSVSVLIGALLYSYEDLDRVVKIAAAPHVFFLEQAKQLVTKHGEIK
jgi:hypothetical protein